MSLSTQPYKGARDFYPEDKRLQKYMFGIMREVCERFGYEEYDAPILEPTELFASKTSDEIVNEQTYTFIDRGDRSVTIRTEMTPSVSRMVAGRRQELAYPARWYSIPNIWRYERPQRGRLREFWQLNVDLFGVSGIEADHEVILVADSILKAFGATNDMFEIRVSSRKLVDRILDAQGMQNDEKKLFLRIRDKWEKFDSDDKRTSYIHDTLKKSNFTDEQIEIFLNKMSIRGEAFDDALHNTKEGQNLKKLLDLCVQKGINIKFDSLLTRGFDYYTDIVFEVFDTSPENNRSMFGGGRYDGLVGLFGVEPVPTVGFGMGDVTLQNFLEVHKLLPQLRTETDAYLILVGDVYEKAQKAISELREMGINLAVDSTGRKPDKQLKAAVKNGAHFVIFIGEKELADDQLVVKNLHNGEEERHGIQRTVSILKDYRQK